MQQQACSCCALPRESRMRRGECSRRAGFRAESALPLSRHHAQNERDSSDTNTETQSVEYEQALWQAPCTSSSMTSDVLVEGSERELKQSKGRRSAPISSWSTTLGSILLLALVALTSAPMSVVAQGTANGNPVGIRGTWSTGAGHVVTGLQFFNPANNTFTYPATAGQAYSFTDDGHWEQALYLYQPRADKPFCVTAQLIWQHGKYVINANNSITLTPFKGDGQQQIASRCSQTSQSSQPYNQPEFMQGYEIRLDSHFGQSAYYLKMYEFDGTPKPLMWKIYDPPQMLPTAQLKEVVLNQGAA